MQGAHDIVARALQMRVGETDRARAIAGDEGLDPYPAAIVVLLILAPARRGGRAAGPLPPAD